MEFGLFHYYIQYMPKAKPPDSKTWEAEIN